MKTNAKAGDIHFSCYRDTPHAKAVLDQYAKTHDIPQEPDGSFLVGGTVVGAGYDSWTGHTEIECIGPLLREARDVFYSIMRHANLNLDPLESAGVIVREQELYGW